MVVCIINDYERRSESNQRESTIQAAAAAAAAAAAEEEGAWSWLGRGRGVALGRPIVKRSALICRRLRNCGGGGGKGGGGGGGGGIRKVQSQGESKREHHSRQLIGWSTRGPALEVY